MEGTVDEAVHDVLELGGVHLAVRGFGQDFGHDGAQECFGFLQAFDAVVQVEYLAAALDLRAYGLRHQVRVEFGHGGLYGLPVRGWRAQDGHVADFQQRHVQGARNGRGGQGQAIDARLHFLQPLLVLYAEALLLVDHQEPQVLEAHVLLQKAVRAHHHVHLALFHGREGLALVLFFHEARHHGHVHGKIGQAFAEILEMLFGEDGGGRQEGDLLARRHGLEAGAQGYFGLAVAHVAADQAVHGAGAFHVALDLVDAGELVLGFLVGERGFEGGLPFPVGRKGVALGGLAPRVDADQALGEFLDRFPDLFLAVFPGFGSDPIEFGRLALVADVALHEVGLLDRHEDGFLVVVLDLDVIALVA